MAGTERDLKQNEAREAAEDSLLSGGERVAKGRQRTPREKARRNGQRSGKGTRLLSRAVARIREVLP